jgi:hypothetical protein
LTQSKARSHRDRNQRAVADPFIGTPLETLLPVPEALRALVKRSPPRQRECRIGLDRGKRPANDQRARLAAPRSVAAMTRRTAATHTTANTPISITARPPK